jgi:hypothetical protein
MGGELDECQKNWDARNGITEKPEETTEYPRVQTYSEVAIPQIQFDSDAIINKVVKETNEKFGEINDSLHDSMNTKLICLIVFNILLVIGCALLIFNLSTRRQSVGRFEELNNC